MKKTLVLGASPNPSRYSYQAIHRLTANGHEVVPVGIRKGEVAGLKIHTDRPQVEDLDTITLYIGPARQPDWYDYLISLSPNRIIFNPGTENEELMALAKAANIEVEVACTLVMLGLGNY